MISSFLYVNSAPQDPFTNQNPWRKLEERIRNVLKFMKTPSFEVSGVCKDHIDKIGLTRDLEVPSCFWKLICFKKFTSTFVVGFYASNSKVETQKQKEDRENEVNEMRSQRFIREKTGVKVDWKKVVRVFQNGKFDLSMAGNCERAMNLPPSLNLFKPRNKRDVLDMDEFSNSTDLDDEEIETTSNNEKRLVGFFPSWGEKHLAKERAQILSHLIFAFFEIHDDGSIEIGAPKQLSNPVEWERRLGNLLRIKTESNDLNTMFSIGGFDNFTNLASIVRSPSKRLNFIASALQIVDKYDFDGVDIFYLNQDKVYDPNIALLLKEMREAFDEHSKRANNKERYLISATLRIPDSESDVSNYFDFVDFLNVVSLNENQTSEVKRFIEHVKHPGKINIVVSNPKNQNYSQDELVRLAQEGNYGGLSVWRVDYVN